jgi:thiol:disulfide interchange protein DsbD
VSRRPAVEKERILPMIASLRTPALFCALGIGGLLTSLAAWSAPQFGAAPNFLKATVAAPKSVIPGKAFTVTITLNVSSPYHIQGNPPGKDYIATAVSVAAPKGFTADKAVYPKASEMTFSGEKIPVFTGKLFITVQVTADRSVKPGSVTLPVTVSYQGCNDTSCFPPAKVTSETRVTVRKAAPTVHVYGTRHA